MENNDNEVARMVTSLKPFLRNQNLGFQSRFRTSDISQEVAVQLIKRGGKLPHDEFGSGNAANQAWLLGVAKNVACKMRRSNLAAKRSVKSESTTTVAERTHSDTPAANAMHREISVKLVLAISKLDEDARKIIDYHYCRGFSLAETARTLGMCPNRIHRAHKKALEQLRKLLPTE